LLPSEDDCWRKKIAWEDHYGKNLRIALNETMQIVTQSHSESYVCGGFGNDRPRYCHRTWTEDLQQIEGKFQIDGVTFHAITLLPLK